MSHDLDTPLRDRRGLRRAAVLLAVLLGLVLLAVGGSLLPAESASPPRARTAVVGRTSVVCTVPPPVGTTPAPASTLSAVTVRQGGQGGGRVSATPLDAGGQVRELQLTEPGTGAQLASVTAPVVLSGEGTLATALSGVVASTAAGGEAAGLMAAPCLAPATEQWFAGLGSSDADRTELILSNPDDAQAEVDLRFYGPSGRVVVPGSPGVLVGARETRTVSVSSLVQSPGPVSVAVRASAGRVSVAARRLRTAALQPAGADWQTPSVTPATAVLIPGLPGGSGTRLLEVVNPGSERARVAVEVLGLSGAFAPAGADTVEVPAESTAAVELTAGLAGESGSVRLRSDHPVTAAVVSTSRRTGARADLAVQSAQPALVRQGVSAVATTAGPIASELVLSNGGDTDSDVAFEVLSYDGVSLRRDDVLLAAGTSATRRVTSPGPSYVVVTVPDGSAVVGSVTLAQPEGDVAGLATVPLTSPDVAARAPRVQPDPAVGR